MTEQKNQNADCFKPCTACGTNVHNRSKACKKCGAVSPWAAATSPHTPPQQSEAEREQQERAAAPAEPAQGKTEPKKADAPVNTPPAAKENEKPEEVAIGHPPYIVLRQFSTYVGDVMVALPAKRVLTDQRLITALLASNAPILPLGQESEVVVCPCCKHIFSKSKDGGKAAA